MLPVPTENGRALCSTFIGNTVSSSLTISIGIFTEPLGYDLLIENGTIVDGSGSSAFQGDIAVVGDEIVRLGNIEIMFNDLKKWRP